MRLVASLALAFFYIALNSVAGQARDPFASAARARVFLFVRTDCPVTNQYAPELQRLAREFAGRGVEFWLVYPNPAETARGIEDHIAQYRFPGVPLRDSDHRLAKRAQATVAPEAAVFDAGAGWYITGVSMTGGSIPASPGQPLAPTILRMPSPRHSPASRRSGPRRAL